LSAEVLLVDLTATEREDLCQWIVSLPRPGLADCPAANYISVFALHSNCLGIHIEGRPNCQATFEDVAACAVAVDDCETTVDSPGACGIFVLPECAPDPPID
jgi:hypothetical protein